MCKYKSWNLREIKLECKKRFLAGNINTNDFNSYVPSQQNMSSQISLLTNIYSWKRSYYCLPFLVLPTFSSINKTSILKKSKLLLFNENKMVVLVILSSVRSVVTWCKYEVLQHQKCLHFKSALLFNLMSFPLPLL